MVLAIGVKLSAAWVGLSLQGHTDKCKISKREGETEQMSKSMSFAKYLFKIILENRREIDF